ETLMNSLQPGQTCEIANAYVGMIDKVPARVIAHRLTKQQQNGQKSHRYEKKTVFNILGVVYNCTLSDNQAA
ncbi:TPA: hypothetical protein ACQ444_003478, partial [Bacillus cereus]